MDHWRKSVGKLRYRNSPLVEALCEFEFSPTEEQKPSLIAELGGSLAGEYPRRQSLKTFEAQVKVNPQGVEQGLIHGEREQFLSEDGTSLVQIAPNVLTINELAPYAGWALFKPRIQNALGFYSAIVGSPSLLRISLRYINRIELHGPIIDPDEWFSFCFREPVMGDIPKTASFLVGLNYQFPPSERLRIELASIYASSDTIGTKLDIEYVLAGENVHHFADIGTWLEKAHDIIESAWLGSITQTLHMKFEPEALNE